METNKSQDLSRFSQDLIRDLNRISIDLFKFYDLILILFARVVQVGSLHTLL